MIDWTASAVADEIFGQHLSVQPADAPERTSRPVGCSLARLGETGRRGQEDAMTYVTNRLDATRISFEDDGGEGVPVVLYGGFLDSVVDVRESNLARSLPAGEFRTIYVDHRGLGRSDKPHEPAASELHPVNGFAILLVGILTAREAWLSRGATASEPSVAESAVSASSR